MPEVFFLRNRRAIDYSFVKTMLETWFSESAIANSGQPTWPRYVYKTRVAETRLRRARSALTFSRVADGEDRTGP